MSPRLSSDLESPQLTSLYSLQSSLDTLRTHRPDYTPRTGFIWPITDPSLTDDTSRKRGADGELPSVDSQHDESAPPTKHKVSTILNVSKKQQNNMLLLNAMKTTAVHSNTSFSTRAFETRTESAPPETPQGGMRSSATPAPTATRGGTPKASSAPTPQEPSTKTPAGGGKKKRKSKHTYGYFQRGGAHITYGKCQRQLRNISLNRNGPTPRPHCRPASVQSSFIYDPIAPLTFMWRES